MSQLPTFGYVRLAAGQHARVEHWRRCIASYCWHEGLALELVFADIGVLSTQLVRPGWTALLDILALYDTHVVVVPSVDHLSRRADLRTQLCAQLSAVDVAVLVVPKSADRLTGRRF